MSERMPALFAAQAVAMSARTDGLTLHAVEDMRTKAEELLMRDDPLRAAVLTFASMFEVHHRDKAALADLGVSLELAVAQSIAPVRPELRWRADIDG